MLKIYLLTFLIHNIYKDTPNINIINGTDRTLISKIFSHLVEYDAQKFDVPKNNNKLNIEIEAVTPELALEQYKQRIWRTWSA